MNECIANNVSKVLRSSLFMRHIFGVCASVFVLLSSQVHAQDGAKWEATGTDVLVGLSSPSSNKSIILAVGFPKTRNCQPEISAMVIEGNKLGKILKQRTAKKEKNQLQIFVGEKKYSGETKFNEYTNGLELVMMANDDLLRGLSSEHAPVRAKIGDFEFFKLPRISDFRSERIKAEKRCSGLN